MKKIQAIILSHASISLMLFVVFASIYWFSIPNEFNTQAENRKYFDSDGEFIVRQYHQQKIFTHNDHLLYHILGKAIAGEPETDGNKAVTAHKFLSVVFGALGVSLFYIFGVLITKRKVLTIVCAVFAAGTAGWWFFSSTIDTYIPCLSVSIPVIGFAVLALRCNTRYKAVAIGSLAGLAFLFRTDSILLALMALYVFKDRKHLLKNITYAGTAAFAVGICGYIILSHCAYDIELSPKAMWGWLSGSTLRPESAHEKIWGVASNITLKNSLLVFTNQLLYTILLPGLEKTRDASFYFTYTNGAWISLIIWLTALSTGLFYLISHAKALYKKGDSTLACICLLCGVWFLSRMLFYTWWDPYDPFLFAVMSLPSLWLVLLVGFEIATSENTSSKNVRKYWALLIILTIAVWAHNTYYLIRPLRTSTCEKAVTCIPHEGQQKY